MLENDRLTFFRMERLQGLRDSSSCCSGQLPSWLLYALLDVAGSWGSLAFYVASLGGKGRWVSIC